VVRTSNDTRGFTGQHVVDRDVGTAAVSFVFSVFFLERH
jgi:hypothetical protein